MSLTKSDIQQIVTALEPRFNTVEAQIVAALEPRFNAIDSRFDDMEYQIESLARATKEQFDVVIGDLDLVKDDLAVIKDIVKDHSFRIARLEHRR